jgi:AcrR family transcriptional regulator
MATRQFRTPSSQIGAEVLAAGLAILEEDGPDGFTVRAIASHANVAPMAIYNHFDGKNGVLEAIWNEGFEQLRMDLSASSDDPHADVVSAGLAYRNFALEHRAHYTVMFMHHFVGFEPSLDASHAAARTFQELVTHVERCQALGFFGSYRATNVAQMMWATSHGYVALEILNINFSDDPDATFRNLLNGLWNGLAR